MSRLIPSFLYGYEWDNAFDNCLTEDKYYTFGSYIDLCGMSAEDAMNWQNRVPVVPSGDTSGSTSGDTSGDTETTANTLYISFTETSGRYQMNISPEYQTESSVEMTIILNEDKFVVDIDSSSGVVSEGGGTYKVTVPSKTKGKYNVGIYATAKESDYSAGDILISKESSIDPTLKYDDKKYDYSTKIVADGFVITFILDGVEYTKKNYAFGETIVAPDVTPETGYTFNGWENVPSTMPAKDITINGRTTPNTYQIKYYVDGNLVHTDSFAYKSTVTEYTYTPATGYIFNGWSTEVPQTMPYNDVEIQGTTTAKVYTVKYVVDGVERDDLTQTYSYGDTIVLPTIDEQEGYRIVWGEHPTTVPDVDVTTITVNHVINQYTLTLTVDGKPYTSITQDFGTAISVTDPTKEGYSFAWSAPIPATMPSSDTTINGVFTVNQYTLTLTVEGEPYTSFTQDFGTAISVETPTREGYSFAWDSPLPTTMPSSDVTIDGAFTINQYTLTLTVDGEPYTSFTQDFGTAISVTDPTKEGYSFAWSAPIPATMPSSDTTINGVFTVNQYTLTLTVGGEAYSSITQDYGSVISVAEPTKEGYSFAWDEELPETMPAENITINGEFTINQYTLILSIDGSAYTSLTLNYGTEITVEEPTREGYSFAWEKPIPATMPAYDQTINGVFTVNQYTLTLTIDNEPYSSITQDYGTGIVISDPTQEGYSFAWDEELPETMPAQDMTVNGTFTINQYVLTFTIEGNFVSSGSVDYNSVITYPSHAEREGYDFAWDSNITNMPAHDVTIDGEYTVQSFILTFIVDNVFVSSGSVEYGSTIVYPTVAEREGYVFSWDSEPTTMPAQDLTISGTYTEIKNKVYYGCMLNTDIDNLSDYSTLANIEVETGDTYDLHMVTPQTSELPDDDAPDAEWDQWEEDNKYGYIITIPSTITTYVLQDRTGTEVSSNTNPRHYVVVATGVMIDGTDSYVLKYKTNFADEDGGTDVSKKLII